MCSKCATSAACACNGGAGLTMCACEEGRACPVCEHEADEQALGSSVPAEAIAVVLEAEE